MIVFYGCEGSGSDKKMGGGRVDHILISASVLWRGNKFKNFFPPEHDVLFLDSGGYSFFNRVGDYPFSVSHYVELAKKLDANFVSVLDYPCEPDVLRDSGLSTNIERIERTIRNAKECMKHNDINWVMVIQGYELSEYQYCCDRVKDEGLETDVIAIGSLCVRKKVSDARKIISLVRRNFPHARLHGFGVDLKFLRDVKIRSMLWSTDTQAWRWCNNGKYHFPMTEQEKLDNFNRYRLKVESIMGSGYKQLQLEV
jgi:tRNA-guanine family transglycosylase